LPNTAALSLVCFSNLGILASHNCDFVRIAGFIMAMESKILQLEQEVSVRASNLETK
jgi:hypothetical protein